jgi:monoamine oxidase
VCCEVWTTTRRASTHWRLSPLRHLQFDDRYGNGQGPWGIGHGFIFTDLPFQSSWDASRAQPGVNGLLVDYTGGSQGAGYHPPTPYSTSKSSPLVEQFARQCLSQLEGPWPGITPHYTGLATLSYPTGDPNKLGSYSAWKVGQYTLFSGYETERVSVFARRTLLD